MIDAWINNGSGLNVELIKAQYINVSTYRPLSGSSYMDLLVELKSPRKVLINIKNKDQKCFLWCHEKHPEKFLKTDKKKLLENLIMMELNIPCKKKILTKLKLRTIFVLMCLVMKMG